MIEFITEYYKHVCLAYTLNVKLRLYGHTDYKLVSPYTFYQKLQIHKMWVEVAKAKRIACKTPDPREPWAANKKPTLSFIERLKNFFLNLNLTKDV